MPTNNVIPTLSTGNVLTATEWNDLTVLNTCIALFGASGTPLVGSLPTATAPNWELQIGSVSGTTSAAGAISFAFPTPFPNGVMFIHFMNAAGASGYPLFFRQLINGTASLSGGQMSAWSCATSGTAPAVQASTAGVTGTYITLGW